MASALCGILFSCSPPPSPPPLAWPPPPPSSTVDSLLDNLVLPLPDVSWIKDGLNCSLTGLTCSSVRLDRLATRSVSPGTLRLQANGLTAVCNGAWAYHLVAWPHIPNGAGGLTAVGGAAHLQLELAPSRVEQEPLLCSNCSCEASVKSVVFSGGLQAHLINHFETSLRAHMQALLDERTCGGLNDTISASEAEAFASPEVAHGPRRVVTRRARLLLGALALAAAITAAAGVTACLQSALLSLQRCLRARSARKALAGHALRAAQEPLPRVAEVQAPRLGQ